MVKKIYFFLFIIYAVGICAPAQNFQMVNPLREMTYLTKDSVYAFVKVDSTKLSGIDSIFFIKPILDTIETDECSAIYNLNSVLGNKVIIKGDGTHQYFNKTGDTITFKTKANLGEVWRLYTYANGAYINGTLNSYEYLTVMPDVEDTLKGVKIRIYDSLGVQQTDSLLDGKTIDFTKEFGLVQTFNLNDFPYDTALYYLRGITLPDTGIVDIKKEDIFNFLPGYEFHYREYEITGDATNYLQTERFYKYFILSKSDYVDSVVYEAYRVEIDYVDNPITGFDTVRYLDTVSFSILYDNYRFLDTLELSVLQHGTFGYSDLISNDIYNGIPHKYVYSWFDYDTETFCLTPINSNDLPQQIYGEGIGTIYYKDSTDTYNNYELELMYFQKGLIQWGEPINFDTLGFVEIEHYEISQIVKIYPNPVSTYLHLTMLNGVNVICRIMNQKGQIFMQKEIIGSEALDVSQLETGFYLCQIVSDSLVKTVGFIKE
ncbi:MAG: T9SS type A sorting domain-containing protein [Chitinophagales bacterium]